MTKHLTLLGFALFALSVAGCDIFRTGGPEEARLQIQGVAGKSVDLIISTQFLSQTQPVFDSETGISVGDTTVFSLFAADTFSVTLPFDQEYDIRDRQQFFAQVLRMEPQSDAIEGRLWVDGDLKIEQRPGSTQESVLFIYNFRDGQVEEPPPDET